jgi:hypothetical protein
VTGLTAHLALLALITTGAGAGMIWLGLDRGMLRFRWTERRCPSCDRLIRGRVCPTCAGGS